MENIEQIDGVETALMNAEDIRYLQEKGNIDVQISTAKQYPRNVRRAIDNAIYMVTMDVETAQTCAYSLPRGGKSITGASVHLAKILAQNWGNLRVEAKVVNIDAKHITSQAIAFDLENNLAIKVEVKRSITDRNGKRYNDDMITVTGNACNSIALRNAILAVIPKAVTDRVYSEAKKKITGDISDKTKFGIKRKQVFDGFKDVYGVSEAEVLKVVGKASVEHIDEDNLVTLIGLAQAIKDGDTSVEETFRKKDKPTSATANTNVEEVDVKVSENIKDKQAKNKGGELPLEG